jgi:hypothetical protein
MISGNRDEIDRQARDGGRPANRTEISAAEVRGLSHAALPLIFERSSDPDILESLGEALPALRERAAALPLDPRILVVKNYRRLLLAALERRPPTRRQAANLFLLACGRADCGTARALERFLGSGAGGTYGEAFVAACKSGRLRTARWLKGKMGAEVGRCAIGCATTEAVSRGHYTTLKWLCEGIWSAPGSSAFGCVEDALTGLMVRYPGPRDVEAGLCFIRDACSREAGSPLADYRRVDRLNLAVATGRADCVALIEQGRALEISPGGGVWQGLIGAASRGGLDLLKVLHERSPGNISLDLARWMFLAACMNGESQTAEWLERTFKVSDAETARHALALAGASDQLEMLADLAKLGLPPDVTMDALELAAADCGGQNCLVRAPAGRYLWDVWFDKNRKDSELVWNCRAARTNAAHPRRGSIAGLLWLDERAPLRVDASTQPALESLFRTAVLRGNFAVAGFICSRADRASMLRAIEWNLGPDSEGNDEPIIRDFATLAWLAEYFDLRKERVRPGLAAWALIETNALFCAHPSTIERFAARFEVTRDELADAIDALGFADASNYLDPAAWPLAKGARNDACLWLQLRFGFSRFG